MSQLYIPQSVLFCSGCKRPFRAPEQSKDVECSHCGKAMHVVNLEPAGEKGQAK